MEVALCWWILHYECCISGLFLFRALYQLQFSEGASRHFQYVKKMHVRNCCAPHGCGLHPVCIYVAAAPLWLSVYVRLHACVGPRVICAWCTWVFSSGPCRRNCWRGAFNSVSLWTSGGWRWCVCVLLMCVCCESLIKYFACKDSEHSLNGASESSGSPSPVSEAGSWVVRLCGRFGILPPRPLLPHIWICHDSNLFSILEMSLLASINNRKHCCQWNDAQKVESAWLKSSRSSANVMLHQPPPLFFFFFLRLK